MDGGAGRGHGLVSAAAEEALRRCRLIQRLVDGSISSLQALRTACASGHRLAPQEIRTLEVTLTKYMWTQLQWKQTVPERERPEPLTRYPRLETWLLTADVTPQFIQAAAGKLSVDGLLQMSSSELQDTMRRLGSNSEDRSRLTAALSCLKSADETGGDQRPDSDSCRCETKQDSNDFSSTSPPPVRPTSTRGPSISISVAPCSVDQRPCAPADESADVFTLEASPPHATQTPKMRSAKPSHTTPPSSRKLLQLLPNIAMKRSKSQESQLANRIEEPASHWTCKKNRVLAAIQINGCGNSPEDSTLRSPLLSARTPGPVPASAPYMMSAVPTLLDNGTIHRSSPKTMRRDIGLAITHRFSTKSWLSQTCQVCHKSMMFGVKCKHCKFKCHNKCTKDAPSCRISFLTLPRMRRAESVPSDINNRINHTAEIPLQYGTLPKAITKRLDSSSNPSSATSSTPSSPAHFQQSNPPSVSTTPPANSSPRGSCDSRFHFPDVPAATHTAAPHSASGHESGVSQVGPTDTQLPAAEPGGEEGAEEDYPVGDEETADQYSSKKSYPTEECDEDGLEDLPSSICRRAAAGRWRGQISRKASQTSIYLQEWDIPYEQLQLGELIGKGRWGKVHKGRWHGEVAIRLLEVDGNNQDHLKLFKKEVMNYRQTRHENVVLFMGACMAPPHLAIITSFCTGLTLYTVVRERSHMLDLNKTRQIAQEIVKGMGYLHAKGIIHKDLKSKNVFYDKKKVVITDFGLFGMSGVVQEGRRKNVLRIPQGWIYYLAPEIVRRMSPEVEEDQLPFSKAADVYAFGTIWYELQVGDWPITNQPVEAKIWLVGSNEGMKKVLADANLGKEVTEILSSCWSSEADDRPTFTQLAGMLERLPKLNRRLSHPGHFCKTNELWDRHHCLGDRCHQGLHAHMHVQIQQLRGNGAL
ncbi:kinase suppressor of Ras 1-like isoform X2 [Scophthalmus maximus]|uniref:kinase suppressor of Ras 1-like isoform X2 n=1 Tax=Scophthalmus maximus TaxID=52904 RepID=UPI001FA8B9B9|nr:kinase suppressor of Ras 1-like isoform X2 [Scophthalmus maximus]